MDDWPPANFDYDALLKEKGLRQVDIINWKNEPEKDEKGKKNL